MPPLATPSRAPARSYPRSQFASTPRFLLSQQARSSKREARHADSIISDDDATPRPAERARRLNQPLHRKEVIEDSNSQSELRRFLHETPGDGTGPVEITSSPPADTAELDAEIEALFGAPAHHTKRRRVSKETVVPVTGRRKPREDIIVSSSPERLPSSPSAVVDPPSPSLPYRTPIQTRPAPTSQRTPRPPPTPVTTTTNQTLRNYPRFIVSSSSHQPSSVQPLPRTKPSPTTASPPPRRKPTFVLPRSPSPSQTDDPTTIPTPFSPSTNALRRRGGHRSSTPSYLPGGMAAEVRSWILETGSKREHLLHTTPEQRPDINPIQRYMLVLHISAVRQSALGSCGPLAFLRGRPLTSLELEVHDEEIPVDDAGETGETRNVLLLGAPRRGSAEELRRRRTSLMRVPDLKPGDVVGVCRGLVWELDVEGCGDGGNEMQGGGDIAQVLRGESARGPNLGKWLVGMEWEVISSG